jgi:hypothetical protein
MKLNRKHLRRMILTEIRLLTEGDNLSQKSFKNITKDDIGRSFPKKGTGRFIVYNHKDFKGKKSKDVLDDHNADFKNWKKGKFKSDDQRLTYLAEIPGVFGDVLTASNTTYIKSQFKSRGYKGSDYDFYRHTMLGVMFAVKKDSEPGKSGKYKKPPFEEIDNPGV